MPKLRLFHGGDPLESDVIPFPRMHDAGERFRLRLTAPNDVVSEVEDQINRVQRQLDDAMSLVDTPWFDDDGPRAA